MYIFTMLSTIFTTIINLIPTVTSVKCTEVSNEPCAIRKTLVDLNKNNEPRYYPFVTSLNKCSGSCDIISAPYAKRCLSDEVSEKFIKVYDILNNVNIPFLVKEDKSCKCECIYNSSVCTHPMQKWNENLCKCVCLGDSFDNCKKGYVWNIDICDCVPKIGNIFSDEICDPDVKTDNSLPIKWIVFSVVILVVVCIGVILMVKYRKKISCSNRLVPSY